MKKQIIRLTEEDLHHIINESVREYMISEGIVDEGWFTDTAHKIGNGIKNSNLAQNIGKTADTVRQMPGKIGKGIETAANNAASSINNGIHNVSKGIQNVNNYRKDVNQNANAQKYAMSAINGIQGVLNSGFAGNKTSEILKQAISALQRMNGIQKGLRTQMQNRFVNGNGYDKVQSKGYNVA